MNTNTRSASFYKKVVSFLLICGLVLMLGGFIMHEINKPTTEPAKPTAQLQDDVTSSVAELMQKLSSSPNDSKVLFDLGKVFYEAKDFPRASNFLNRASVSSPSDTQIRYWLSVSLYNEGKFNESAEALEGLLSIESQPEAMYNLGVMYKHRLNQPEKAKKLFEKLLSEKSTSEDIRKKVHREMESDS